MRLVANQVSVSETSSSAAEEIVWRGTSSQWEKFRRIFFVRSFLLAHRADFLRAGLLSPNKMQSVRANNSAL